MLCNFCVMLCNFCVMLCNFCVMLCNTAHRGCICTAISSSKRPKCPLCKEPITKRLEKDHQAVASCTVLLVYACHSSVCLVHIRQFTHILSTVHPTPIYPPHRSLRKNDMLSELVEAVGELEKAIISDTGITS